MSSDASTDSVESESDDDSHDESWLRAVAAAPSIDLGPPRLPPGTIVAQSYELLRLMGAGAMGAVYEATDLVLLRRVAVKVQEIGRSDRAARMWREARAMARLSDPHVVAIHEVGVDDTRGYIAMELVDGTNARDWVRARPRTWAEIVAVYRQAGLGLMAAHTVGITHRDFKPDNVLVTADGRAKVADFGIAMDSIATSPLTPGDASADRRSTRTGTIVGTPAYMAPEQIRGERADARSDQYAFFVALHEALHGTWPDGGVRARRHGPAVADVPRWIDDVIARGLADDPTRRHPDMTQAVARLDPAPRRRRSVVLVGAATAFATSVALVWTGGLLAAPQTEAPCFAADAAMDATWSDAVKAELASAFAVRPASFAATTLATIGPPLDVWASQWRDAARESCEATHVLGQQSNERLDARTDCLERARRRVGASVEVLRLADVDAMTRADEIVAGLPDVAMCSRTDASLDADVVAPRQRATYDARLAVLDAASAEVDAGLNRTAKAKLDELLVELEADAFPHLRNEGLRLRGEVHLALGRRNEAIVDLAAAVAGEHGAGNRDALANAMTALARALGRTALRNEEAQRLLAGARAIAEDLQWTASRRVGLEVAAIEIAHYAERYDGALVLADALLAGAQLDLSREVSVRSLRATAFSSLGRFDDAMAAHDETVALVERERGSDHPDTATVLLGGAATLTTMSRYEEALRDLERALAIRIAVAGAEVPIVGEVLRHMSTVQMYLQRHDEAIASAERAIAISRAANDDAGLSLALGGLPTVYEDLLDYARAGSYYGEAIAAAERAFGSSSPQVARLLVNRGVSRFAAGEYAVSATEIERAIAILSETYLPNDTQIATSRMALARVYARLGRHDEAIAMFDAARQVIGEWFRDNPTKLAAVASQYARFLDSMGRTDQALRAWRAMYESAERTLPVDQPLRVELSADYGLRLVEAGEYAEARTVLEAALVRSRALADDEPRTASIVDALARIGGRRR